jgi:hypothetical protein
MEADVRLDEAILEELERGRGTVSDIEDGLSKQIRPAFERLLSSGKIIKAGFPATQPKRHTAYRANHSIVGGEDAMRP